MSYRSIPETTPMQTHKTILALSFCVLATATLAQAQTTPVTCSNATLTGTHSLVLSGRDVLSTVIFSKVYLGVGTATFDGAGNVTFSLTTDTNSSSGVSQTLSGTYSLPSNCLGTLNITSGDAASFTLIPYNSGKNFTLTGQDATYSYTGSGSVAPASCATSTLSGGYVFTGNGYSLASSVIGGVNTISGVLQFDGAGNVTTGSSWSVENSATATPDTVTGQYTVTPSCTATATVKDPSGVTFTLYFTVIAADGSDFSMLVTSPTNTFTTTGHSSFTNPGNAIVLASGFGTAIPPGSLFSIYGSGMSTGQAQPTKFPLPLTLAAATVTVNGEQVPLFYVDKTLINAQMPLDIQPGVATVVVKNGTTVSNSVAINVSATADPSVFVYGSNHAAAQNFPSYSLNSSTNRANIGDIVVVYFTGGGPVTGASSLVTGNATPGQAFPVTETVTATIAGVPINLSLPGSYVGLVPTAVGGFYQANVVIPQGVAAGDRLFVITIGGKASNATLVSVN